jgi:hypothetical protein
MAGGAIIANGRIKGNTYSLKKLGLAPPPQHMPIKKISQCKIINTLTRIAHGAKRQRQQSAAQGKSERDNGGPIGHARSRVNQINAL